MRLWAFGFFAVALAQPQSPQEESVARQRQTIQRQLEQATAVEGSIAAQERSVDSQRRATIRAPIAVWGLNSGANAAAAQSPDCPSSPRAAIDPILEKAAADTGLSVGFLRAVIRRESSFVPCAVSPAGAMGLMQLMPSTASALNVTNPFDPEQNVLGGSRLLRSLLEKYQGNLALALGAYNAGPSRVDAAGGVPPIRETQDYVSAILGSIASESPP